MSQDNTAQDDAAQDNAAETQLLGDLVAANKRGEETETNIAFATQEVAKLTKKMDTLITGILVSLAIVVGVELLMTFLRNRTMILGITKAGATTWPANGFATALAFQFPALSGWLGFSDKFLPQAAWVCFNYYYDTGSWFRNNTRLGLELMAGEAKKGGKGIEAGDLSALSIICGSWGAQCTNPLAPCQARCPHTKSEWSDYVAGGTSSLSSGIFAGSAVGGPAGAAIGGLLFGGLGVLNTHLRQQEQDDAVRKANNCYGT